MHHPSLINPGPFFFQVLLDHLERIFDLALVYHDFYAGALSEHGGPLRRRASLVKKLSEFVGETQCENRGPGNWR